MTGTDMSPVAPMAVLGGISYANAWYNTKNPLDVKPLVFAGIGAGLLALAGEIPGAEPVVTLLAWVAVVGMFIGPVQSPSPADNLLKITGSK